MCWIVSFCNADLSVFHRENFEIIVSSDERFLLLEFTIIVRSYINIVMGIDTKLKSLGPSWENLEVGGAVSFYI